MALQSFANKLFRQAASRARSFETGLQRVVEVISPGPLGANAEACDARRQLRAARAVQEAIKRWESSDHFCPSESSSRSKL